MLSRSVCVLSLATFLISGVVRSDDDLKVNINGDDSVAAGLRFFMRLYDDCNRKDGLSPCLKMKAITFFDRAMRSLEIPLTESLVLVQNGAATEQSSVPRDQQQGAVGRSLTEAEIEASLPDGNYEARDLQLNKLLLERVARFFNTYRVQIAFPKMDTSDLKRNLEEGVYSSVLPSKL
jgi:hypothetical protein